VSSALHTVHVRVNDATTGQPTPVRIRFTGPDGRSFLPLGRSPDPDPDGRGRVPESADTEGIVRVDARRIAAYIDGACEVRLPAGLITVEIDKGPEFVPVRTTTDLPPGKLALRFGIQRWTDLRAERWYSGDIGAFGLTPHAALLEGAAEDLAVVQLLTHGRRNFRPPITAGTRNLPAFSGQKPALEAPGQLVAVGTYNTHEILGHLALLHSHRAVYPLTFGPPDGCEDWTLADWCDQCHRKRGLVVWVRDSPNDSGEALADLILGKIDALYNHPCAHPGYADYYRLLDCNVRVPLVAGSHKLLYNEVLGHPRSYARLQPDQALTYSNWIDAIRAGRTFVTRGPLLDLTINGQEPGAVIELPANTDRVRVRASARSQSPFERLEIVINGHAVAAVEASGSPSSAIIEGELEIPGSGWIAARCWGGDLADPAAETVTAHTSPTYVEVAESPHAGDPINVAYLLDQLNQTLHWAEHGARYENEKQREALTGIFKSASAELVKKAGGTI